MKTVAVLSVVAVAALASSSAEAAASGMKVTIHSPATAQATTAKAFAKLAHLKSTPWDADPKVKATKCEDLCYLGGFFSFQEGRNCVSRPTDLCMQYKLGKVAMEAVVVSAECDCSSDSNSTTASGSNDEGDDDDEGSNDGEVSVEITTSD